MAKYHKLTIALIVIISVVAVFVPSGSADEWALPKKENYYSPNRKFYLEVVPKKLESRLKYFEDKVQNKANAGAASNVKDNEAKGVLYARRTDDSYYRKSTFPLVNEVSPVDAIVSNDGKYIVTFDNWHSAGYGDDVVVIYRSDGSLIRKFGLDDLLTEGDIERLPRSVSSIWWGKDHYIDESTGKLVLRIVSNRTDPWVGDAQYRELKIELADGRTVEPKHNLLSQAGSADDTSVVASEQEGVITGDPGQPVCLHEATFDQTRAVQVSSSQLLAHAKERPVPAYPPIARLAHAEGVVQLRIIASAAGDVICVQSLSGHPLLRGAATLAALKWKFEPFTAVGGSGNVIGTFAISFKFIGNTPTRN